MTEKTQRRKSGGDEKNEMNERMDRLLLIYYYDLQTLIFIFDYYLFSAGSHMGLILFFVFCEFRHQYQTSLNVSDQQAGHEATGMSLDTLC